MTVGGLGTSARRRRVGFPVLELLSAGMLLAALMIFVVELVGFSRERDRLQADITVGGIPVGNLTSVEAQALWEQVYAQPVELRYQGSPIILEPASIGFRTNSEVMLAEALSRSTEESNFWLAFWNYLWRRPVEPVDVALSAEYQRSVLRDFLEDVARRYDRPAGTPRPNLETLTVEVAEPGYTLDVERAIELVDRALQDPNNRTVELPVTVSTPRASGLEALRDLIVAYLDSQGFIYDGQTTVASVYIMDLTTGEELSLNGDVAFSAASTIKLPILVAYYHYQTFAVPQEDAWLLANSLLCSNNSSSNLLMQIMGQSGTDIFPGLQYVTDVAMQAGARNTYITAPLVLGVEGQEFGSNPIPRTNPNPRFNTDPDPYNQTTAEDMGTLLMMIYDCAQHESGLMTVFPEGTYTPNECRQMLELMSGNDLQRLIQAGVPVGTRVSHKNGWLSTMHADAGIVFPPNGHDYVIAVYVWQDGEFFDYQIAWPLIEEISRAAWNYFSPETPMLSRRTDLPPTAQSCDLFLPPSMEETDLNDIDGWRTAQ
ncbi:MAG: serine hydrolase [Anaerolineae bacterium]